MQSGSWLHILLLYSILVKVYRSISLPRISLPSLVSFLRNVALKSLIFLYFSISLKEWILIYLIFVLFVCFLEININLFMTKWKKEIKDVDTHTINVENLCNGVCCIYVVTLLIDHSVYQHTPFYQSCFLSSYHRQKRFFPGFFKVFDGDMNQKTRF